MSARKAKPSPPHRVSQREIADSIRHQIIEGRLTPGQRLPTYVELQQQFDSSRMTVDLAMARLQAEGFVRARPKIGTFVSERPPHLWRFGLVFRGSPRPAVIFDWSRYYDALLQAAEEITRCGPVRFEVFYDIDGHAESEATQQLLHQITTQQLAGLIFVGPRQDLLGSALLEEGSVPRVMTSRIEGCGSPIVTAAPQFSLPWVLKQLHAQGRRRVGLLTLIQEPGEYHPDRVMAAVRQHGMETRRAWVHPVNAYESVWVRHVIAGILEAAPKQRPDAILITDDHLVHPAAEALWEFGIRSPRDMAVIAHWNFPLTYRSPLPIQLVGSDARQQLLRCLENLQAQQRGEPVPSDTALPLILEAQSMSLADVHGALAGSVGCNKS